MKPTEFNPKNGLLQLSFSNGTAFSIDLNKSYHREEDFYVDLFWEETHGTTTLSLALHPKATDLIISSCTLEWPLTKRFPLEVLTKGFSSPSEKGWHNPLAVSPKLGLLKKLGLKKVNAYDPLPHSSQKRSSYQSISLRDNQRTIEAKSIDESAALTVFSISSDGSKLCAENQSSGYQLRHSFPAFELLFTSAKTRTKTKEPVKGSVFSVGISPSCVTEGKLAKMMESTFFTEGNLKSIVLQSHTACCPGDASFDVSLYSAFAKTCLQKQLLAGITLNPFVVPIDSRTTGIKIIKEGRFKRWSPSLCKYVYPIDLSDEDSMRACEQHILRYYQLGFRFFVLQDVSASLYEGLESATTGQQLSKRLDMLNRVLPSATVILDDLCPVEVFSGFQGFRENPPSRVKLPWMARFAGLGKSTRPLNKHNPFPISITEYATLESSDTKEKHKVLDLSRHTLEASTWLGLEATVGTTDYPINAFDVQ